MKHRGKRRAYRWCLICACVILTAAPSLQTAGCSRGGDTAGYNVLLVTLDTTRRDHLGCYAPEGGLEAGLTPNLDALAADGVRFDAAVSTSAATPPSHASILTGLNPYHHGVRVIYAESGCRLPDHVPMLSTIPSCSQRSWM